LLKKQQKAEIVDSLVEQLKDVECVFLVDYRGLKVEEVFQLRTALRKTDSRMRVLRNTLLTRVFKRSQNEKAGEMVEGPTAVIWTKGDIVEAAKALDAFAKEHENLKIKFGILENKIITDKSIAALAKLPPKQVLLGQLVGVLEGPISGLVFALEGVISELVYTLQAVVDKREQTAA